MVVLPGLARETSNWVYISDLALQKGKISPKQTIFPALEQFFYECMNSFCISKCLFLAWDVEHLAKEEWVNEWMEMKVKKLHITNWHFFLNQWWHPKNEKKIQRVAHNNFLYTDRKLTIFITFKSSSQKSKTHVDSSFLTLRICCFSVV